MSELIPRVALNSGTEIPQLGIGVFLVDPATTQANVEQALELGYRHIDTATGYHNETEVGKAIKASGLARDELFITTKFSNVDHRTGDVKGAFNRSLEMLDSDYVDLYLIHWPMPKLGKFVQTWLEFEEFYRAGQAKAIGVSNFMIENLEQLAANATVTPAVNQVELHPLFQQRELRAYLAKVGIKVEAWGPLGQGRFKLDEIPTLTTVAQAHGKTPAQVILRWHIQEGTVIFPKANSLEHQKANLDIFDFELSEAELTAIRALDTGHRLAADPAEVN
ncbi:MAG: aldo/keto reductase [Propionibacteriaceae bacterium]|jgi:2,5-diketo-D-gluconate reductase A|nr:aldo/keto reductase [Propionibacteriaceae bacterium]